MFNICSETQVAKSKLAASRKPRVVRVGKRKKTSHLNSEPKVVSVYERIKEFPDQSFIINLGKLYCTCCSTEISLKKSTIANHIGLNLVTKSFAKETTHTRKLVSSKEEANRLKRFQAILTETPQSASLQTVEYASPEGQVSGLAVTPVIARLPGGSLPLATQLHRMEVCEAFLEENIVFQLLRQPEGRIRRLLEYRRGSLPVCDVACFIPIIRDIEINKLKHELIESKWMSFSYDGTTAVAELFAVVVRFISANKNINQRCLHFKLLQRSLSGTLMLFIFLRQFYNLTIIILSKL